MSDPRPLAALEDALGYRFSHPELLAEALRHSSYVNERPGEALKDNERLEFLGDAVLNLAVGHMLMQRYPRVPEGTLSRMRAGLVNEAQLAGMARKIDLGTYLLLGKGEERAGGHEKNSILADAFEAVAAAVYIDGGFEVALNIIDAFFSAIATEDLLPAGASDYKSFLQELVQNRGQHIPRYTILKESGPDHDKTFHVELNVLDIQTSGVGKSKKQAEQDAARKAIDQLHHFQAP